jgi:tetratricopeptide (TPR) repeat protein
MRYLTSISLALIVHVLLSIVVLMVLACTNKQDSGEKRSIDATVAAGVQATMVAEGVQQGSKAKSSTAAPSIAMTNPTQSATSVGQSAEEHYNSGVKRYKSKDYHSAIAEYTKAIKLNPNFGMAYGGRGTAHSELEQYEQAIEDFEKYIQLAPDKYLFDAYQRRGSAYANLGEYHQAIQDFDTAIELDPFRTLSYISRGAAHAALGEHEAVIRDFDKVVQLEPEFPYIYKERAISHDALGHTVLAQQDRRQACQLDTSLC